MLHMNHKNGISGIENHTLTFRHTDINTQQSAVSISISISIEIPERKNLYIWLMFLYAIFLCSIFFSFVCCSRFFSCAQPVRHLDQTIYSTSAQYTMQITRDLMDSFIFFFRSFYISFAIFCWAKKQNH